MNRWEGIDEAVMVAEMGSFVHAAARLGTAPSNVSRAVARLEQRLHTQIFTRTTRIVKLTDTGALLIARFQRLVAERDEAIATLENNGEPQGTLRVTCSVALGERFVAPILGALCRDHPKLSVQLDLTNRLVDIIPEGYDMAIRTGAMTDSSLMRTQIARRAMVTCAAPAYLARHGKPARIADLADHECLIGTLESWQFLDDGAAVHWRPQGRWRCNSGTAIVDAALGGMGLCQLPEFYVSAGLASGRLQTVLDDHHAPDEPIWAVYPATRHLSAKIQRAIARLRLTLGQRLREGIAP